MRADAAEMVSIRVTSSSTNRTCRCLLRLRREGRSRCRGSDDAVAQASGSR